MKIDHELNYKHAVDPQEGDYWHEMFAPCFLVIERNNFSVSFLEKTKLTEEGRWTWDISQISTSSLNDFTSRLLYSSMKDKTWCDVNPNWEYANTFIEAARKEGKEMSSNKYDLSVEDFHQTLNSYSKSLLDRVDQLEFGPGGIMEMKQTIADKEAEIERLQKKCDMQASILRRLSPDRFPDTLFISGVVGNRDQNNMPQKLLVVPAYGVDFSYIYERTEKTTGPEW